MCTHSELVRPDNLCSGLLSKTKSKEDTVTANTIPALSLVSASTLQKWLADISLISIQDMEVDSNSFAIIPCC